MRRSSLLLLTVLLGLVAVPFPQLAASASCAGPQLTINQGAVLVRGAAVTVEGKAFADGCRDSQTCSGVLGCHSCEYDDPPPTAARDVDLQLVQRGRTWELGTTDAGTADEQQLGQVAWTFDVPTEARPGRAELVADGAQPVPIRLR